MITPQPCKPFPYYYIHRPPIFLVKSEQKAAVRFKVVKKKKKEKRKTQNIGVMRSLEEGREKKKKDKKKKHLKNAQCSHGVE